jgi:hypothetical protein
MDERRAGFGLSDFLEFVMASMRLLGAANATGGIAAGAAFHAFKDIAHMQTEITNCVVYFLAGVGTFTFAYIGLFMSKFEFFTYFSGPQKDRKEWEVLTGVFRGPDIHLKVAAWAFGGGLFMGVASLVLFIFGLGSALQLSIRLMK